jgi:broad specificity phosphatase PhoE
VSRATISSSHVLFLVRHGQTAANARGLLLGRADPPLTELGRRQAAALADALPRPHRLITSPLARARDTAAAFEMPVTVDERWIELDYGELDGLDPASVDAALWAQWRADPRFVPVGGESLHALGCRVREACAELRDFVITHDVVVVSHVSPIKAAVAWALGVDDSVAWRMFVEDAAVARIAVDRRHGPLLRSFNEHYQKPAL